MPRPLNLDTAQEETPSGDTESFGSTSGACHQERVRRILAAGSVLLILGIFGLFVAGMLHKVGEQRSREHIRAVAVAAAASLDPGQLSGLTGSPSDRSTAEYLSARSQLARIQQSNERFRFAYLMGLRDADIMFLADGEPSTSDDYCAPGDLYHEAPARLRQAFETGQPLVEGPYKDRWGEWVSGYAAIRAPDTGAVTALLGVDVDARVWRQRMAPYHALGILVAVSLQLIGLGFMLYVSRVACLNRRLHDEVVERTRAQERLEEAHEELAAREQELSSILRNTPDVVYRLDTEGRIVFISEAIARYGYDPGALVGTDVFEIIHPDDRDKARHWFEERKAGKRALKRLEIRIVARDASVHTAEALATGVKEESVFQLDAEGTYITDESCAEAFVGTQGIARDITQRKEAEEEICTLRAIIPICAMCRKVRSDVGYWQSVEDYLREHADADFSHGYCPECHQRQLEAWASVASPRDTETHDC